MGQAAETPFSPEALGTLVSPFLPPPGSRPPCPGPSCPPPPPLHLLPDASLSALGRLPLWAFLGATAPHPDTPAGVGAGVGVCGAPGHPLLLSVPSQPQRSLSGPLPGVCLDWMPSPRTVGLAPRRGPELERLLPRGTWAALAGPPGREALRRGTPPLRGGAEGASPPLGVSGNASCGEAGPRDAGTPASGVHGPRPRLRSPEPPEAAPGGRRRERRAGGPGPPASSSPRG